MAQAWEATVLVPLSPASAPSLPSGQSTWLSVVGGGERWRQRQQSEGHGLQTQLPVEIWGDWPPL